MNPASIHSFLGILEVTTVLAVAVTGITVLVIRFWWRRDKTLLEP